MTQVTVFQLSRIYAQGWNAASKMPANEFSELDPAKLAAMNPHAAEPERSRWEKGFREAIGK